MKLRLLAAAAFVLVGLFVSWSFRTQPEGSVVTLPPLVAATAPAPISPPRPTDTHPAPATIAAAVPASTDAWRVIGSGWAGAEQPEFAAFRAWTERYLAAAPADRAALLAEGRERAEARRAVLAQLIKADPRAALAAAVPMAVRQELPAEIVALLEERVSGQGRLALNALTPAPGEPVPAETMYRSASIGGVNYRAHVYGRRETQATVPSASLVGIALDGQLALAESPVRIVEPGEQAAPLALAESPVPVPAHGAQEAAPAPLAVEYSGAVYAVCCAGHVTAIEASLLETERVNEADSGPGSSTVVGRPSQAWTHGAKKVLIIRVDFSDRPGLSVPDNGPAITEDFAVGLINQSGGLAEFYTQSSFGKTTLQVAPAVAGDSPDVTGLLRMPDTGASYAASGDDDKLHQDARTLAIAAGFNPDAYDRVGVVFPYIGPQTTSGRNGFAGSLITYGGLANVNGPHFWVNGFYDFRVVGHELGHTYGLRHANLWVVTDGNPVSATGTSLEYGDPFDLMGDGDFFANDFSHWNKSLLQWIPDTAVTVAAASGTYRIYRFDASGANLAQPRALKVVRDSNTDYWIGYRRATTNASMDGGAYVLWGYNNANNKPNLLDLTTPGSNPADAGLAVGATFTDTVAGITLAPVAQGGSGAEEYLDVQVTLQPRIAWTSATTLASEQGGSVVLTARRTANSTGAISVNFATANGTATSPADYTAQSGTLTWANGDMADKTVTITLAPDAVVEGVETFTVTLSGITGGVLGDANVATVSIADPGVRDATFAADFINSTVTCVLPLPDGSAIIGGWFSSVQNDAFQSFARGGITRIKANGDVDPDFATAGGANSLPLRGLARQPDGKILVLGPFSTFNGAAHNRLVRLNTDGSLDSTFNIGTGADAAVRVVLLQPDGKIIVGGEFTYFDGVAREYLARLTADGTLDTTWTGPNFEGWSVKSLALQADGKLLVSGDFYFTGSTLKSGLCRLNTNGALDTTFSGIADGFKSGQFIDGPDRIVVQPDGQIIVAGGFTHYNGIARASIARLTSTGELDANFAPVANGAVNALVYLPDGGVLLGGAFTDINGTAVSRLARLSASGVVDAAYAAAGGHASAVEDLALTADGRVLLAGNFASFQGASPQRPLWRFFSGLNGTPGEVQLASPTYAGTEGNTVQLSVTRSGSGIGALSVGYATVAGTAGAADFTGASGVLTWAAGDTTAKTISVPLATDANAEGVESFTVNLGQPLLGGVVLGANQQAVVDINDPALTGYAGFRAAQFTVSEQANDAISGPAADPDGDGLNNLLEYALGLAPKTADASAALPVVTTTANDWVFTYTRPVSRSDLVYAVHASTNLTTWGPTNVTHSFVSSDGTRETWRGTYPLALGSNVFFRLHVTLP